VFAQSRQYNSIALKRALDCRDFFLAETGTGKRSGAALVARTPWREDRKPSLNVYSDGWIDRATGERGSVIDLVMRLHNLDVARAVEYLQTWLGTSPAPRHPLRPVRPSPPLRPDAPPPAAWQQAALAAVEAAERYLWSARPDAQAALHYLRTVRGLKDETIRRFRLGYNPAWTKTRCRKPATGSSVEYASLAPGIVIPWLVEGALWAVKVRCRVGNLARALGLRPDTLQGEESPKYLNLAGGSQASALFNADALQADKPVFIVEGEFDALLIHQAAGEQVAAVTLGSASYDLPRRWRERLTAVPLVLSALDNDEAGQHGTQRLAQALGSKHRAITLPQGKDTTEYGVEHGGDLAAWVQAALTAEPEPYWRSLPDTWRAALNMYLPDAAAPLVEVLAEAGLLVPGKVLTRPLMFSAALKRGLSRDTVINGSAALAGVFWERIGVLPIAPEADLDQESSGSKTTTALQYRVLPLAAVTANLLKRAACRIWERCNPVARGDPLPRPRPAYFEALGYSETEARALAEELTGQLQPIFSAQHHAERFGERRAKIEYEQLQRALAEARSTPLPGGCTYRNASQYRAVFARAIKEAQPERDLSLKAWAALLGVSERSVSAILKRAGIACIAQYQERAVTSVEEAQRLGYVLKGYPRQLISAAPDGKPREYRYDPERLAQELAAGRAVTVRYQTVNKQVLGGEMPLTAKARSAPATRLAPQKARVVAPKPKRSVPYFEPGHAPGYVRAWLAQALDLSKGYTLQPDGRLLDLSTGEIIADHPSNRELLGLLLGRSVGVVDEVIEFVVKELGGTVVAVESPPVA
jgi:hypothetical protein